jgi:ubiquinone/menaquinone biosynthesis C-methylase UbiE
MSIKNQISFILRKMRLIKVFDKVRFFLLYMLSFKKRKTFIKSHPNAVLPPAYYIYETFGLSYEQYFNVSEETAKWLLSFFEKHILLHNISILDWGCGPGRIIRHIPLLLDQSCRCYGTDYNAKYVKWCSDNIPEATFKLNTLEPPLPFEDNTFDVVYGISIFTHLSEKMHYAWFDELFRVLKPGGILLLTLQGNVFKSKLPESKLKIFDEGDIVALSDTKEGHRTYSTFHPVPFVKKLAGNNRIVEFKEGGFLDGKPQQDVCIFQKEDTSIPDELL